MGGLEAQAAGNGRSGRMKTIFHLAFHVADLEAARRFYGGVLGCTEGRATDTWVDFDFFGHQISLHLGEPFAVTDTGHVGEHRVAMPHFGVVLPLDDWLVLAKRLESAGVAFDIPPVIRFEGQPGEQRTMFFRDPSGNPIEVKGFREFSGIFAR
jgi:extradiol dioxygenase family protein